jgi:hypothetical protein
MKRRVACAVVAGSLALALVGGPTQARRAGKGFTAQVSRIPDRLEDRMRGNSWHRGCPVPIRDLRLVKMSFHGFDGARHQGKLVVHQDSSAALVRVFRAMYRADFKIRRMHLVDRYNSSDQASMRADNTSAFNCRPVAGTNRWSQHAYGRAIDINPVENPYVRSDGSASPRKGRRYTDRSRQHKGMIHSGDATVQAFADIGWGWGGNWGSAKDYQHFSATGT